jgi:hypothetical protein
MNLNLDYLVAHKQGKAIVLTSIFVEVIIVNGNHYEFILKKDTKFQLSNLFWQRRSKDGKDPFYKSADEMIKVIYEYLQYEEQNTKGKFTVEGCALYLGFKSRQSIYDYKNRGVDYSYIIERFLLFMSHYHAQRLTWVGSYQGSSFWLKNFGGYTDESTVNNNTVVTEVKTTTITGTPNFGGYTDESTVNNNTVVTEVKTTTITGTPPLENKE